MKFNCKKNNLKEAISKVERIVSKQPSLPVLSNILIKTQNGRLLVASTNLEIAIETYIGAKIEKEGEITIPAKILNGFLSSVKDDVIEGEVDKCELKIKTNKHNMRIKGMDAEDYPIIPEFPNNSFFVLKPKDLINVIPMILTSVAHNDTRQELNGVYINLNETELTFASTDSCRLSEAAVKFKRNEDDGEFEVFLQNSGSVIIPSLTFSELQRLLNQEDLEVVIDQNQLFVRNNSFKLVSRLINGNYPDYKQILPYKYLVELSVDKEEVLSALKIASLVAVDNNGEVVLKKKEGDRVLKVLSQSSESGENESQVKTSSKKGEFEIIFNCRFLIDGLNAVKSQTNEVLLKINQKKSPVLIRGFDKKGSEDNKISYIIMPIIKD